MNRILVTGNAGSGKTTFSRRLAEKTRLPRYGLDSIVWKTGWVKTSHSEKQKRIADLVADASWIIDGVSSQAFKAANTIYFLDIPLYRCLFNIFKRFLQHGLNTREDLPPGCPEYIGVIKAIRVAISYLRQTRPLLMKLMEEHPEKEIVWIRSYSDLRKIRS